MRVKILFILLVVILAGCANRAEHMPDQVILEALGAEERADFQELAQSFRSELLADSNRIPAWQGSVESAVLLYLFGYSSRDEVIPAAREKFLRLWDLDSLSSESLKLKGIFSFLDWKWEETERSFRAAIKSDPKNLNARHWYALYLSAMGRFNEALAQSDTILSHDPAGQYDVSRGSMLYFARRNIEMRDLMKQAVARDTAVAWAYDWLGMAYCELEDYENSIRIYKKAFELSDGTVEVGAGLGHALGLAGFAEAAKAMADYYVEAAKEHYLPPVQRAFIHIGIGEYDEALALLEQAYAEKSWFLIFMNVEPWYDPIREDHRFQEIVSRMQYPGGACTGWTFSSAPAMQWTALMERGKGTELADKEGWFAADGIFSLPLDGKEEQGESEKKTLFVFSDTYIGRVEKNVPGENIVMVNNSAAWLNGNEPDPGAISFEYNTDTSGRPISYFVPDNKVSKEGEYFWLGDGFINQEKDNALYLFAYHVHKTGPNVFDFEQTNIALLMIPEPDSEGIKRYSQLSTGLGFIHPEYGRVYFGSGIFVNTKEAMAPNPDGYVYIYGIMEAHKSLIAARVKPRDIEEFGKWSFWNGSVWTSEKEDVAPICVAVSNELSLTPAGRGQYLLTFTVLGLSDKIGVRVGESPTGPFGEIHEIYTCPEYAERGLLPYNAKAHYHLSEPGKLLISYNTITYNFWEDIKKDASIYHPRFIWLYYSSF